MRFYFLITLILFSTIYLSAQTKKTNAVNPPVATKTTAPSEIQPEKSVPTVKVIIEKTNGDKLSGLVVSGTTTDLTINFSGTLLTINYDDIKRIHIGAESAPSQAAKEASTVDSTPGVVEQNTAKSTDTTEEEVKKNYAEILSNPKITTTMEEVALFPNNFMNRILEFKGVWIGDLTASQMGTALQYSIEVKSAKGQIFLNGISPQNDINFILAPEDAKAVNNFYQANRRNSDRQFLVNMQAAFSNLNYNNRNYRYAVVRCLQFISIKGSVSSSMGTCN